ncbi:MAG: hypothetical protein Kow0081_2530 [Candidatus Dojkabacteria bacterium]
MNYKVTLLIIFPLVFIGFLLLFPTRSSVNKRSDEYRGENGEQQEATNFVSALQNQNDFPVEIVEDVSELRTAILKEGTGEATVKSGDRIRVHYRGWIASTGEIFDESFSRGDDGFLFIAGTGNVIQGWLQGTIGMKQGEVRRLYIPSELAYGETGSGLIPPNSDLIFDVELVGIE